MGLLRNLITFGRGTMEAVIGQGIFRGIGGKVAAEGVNDVKNLLQKKLTAEHRTEVVGRIRSLHELGPEGKYSESRLLERQVCRNSCGRKSYTDEHENTTHYLPGDEDRMMSSLGKIILYTAKVHVQKEIFLWLGKLEDRKFDAAIEMLHHDPISQWFARALWMTDGFMREGAVHVHTLADFLESKKGAR